MTYRVAPLTEDDWVVLRDIRLRALAESPTSFGSTFAQEEAFAEERWRERARGSVTNRLFVAWHGDVVVGLSGVFDEGDGSAQIVSVWVDPAHRRRGVARALTSAALHGARSRGFETVHLWVTETNPGARALYEGLGFAATGRRQPLPHDSSLDEVELRLMPTEGGAAAAR